MSLHEVNPSIKAFAIVTSTPNINSHTLYYSSGVSEVSARGGKCPRAVTGTKSTHRNQIPLQVLKGRGFHSSRSMVFVREGT